MKLICISHLQMTFQSVSKTFETRPEFIKYTEKTISQSLQNLDINVAFSDLILLTNATETKINR